MVKNLQMLIETKKEIYIKDINYLVFVLDADLNALKESISYLRASERDCTDALFSVVFPVTK
jgi:hypothetical protein